MLLGVQYAFIAFGIQFICLSIWAFISVCYMACALYGGTQRMNLKGRAHDLGGQESLWAAHTH